MYCLCNFLGLKNALLTCIQQHSLLVKDLSAFYAKDDLYDLEKLCGPLSMTCRTAARVAVQVTLLLHADRSDITPGLGSLTTMLLETVAGGTFHPDSIFKENRFILEQSLAEEEM